MTPCNNTKCDHHETYEYESGTLKFPFVRDAIQAYQATRKGDKMHIVRSGVVICSMCSEFKPFYLNTVKPIKKAKKKGK